jgi:hypothetical protein
MQVRLIPSANNSLKFFDAEKLAEFEKHHPSEGRLRLNLNRHRSYFDSFPLPRKNLQAIVAEYKQNPIGLGMINRIDVIDTKVKAPKSLAFINGLRIDKSFRRGTTFRRGFAALAKSLANIPSADFLGFVLKDNPATLQMLLKPQRSRFSAKDLGTYSTFVIPEERSDKRPPCDERLTIRHATHNDLHKLVRFLQSEGSKREFFPYLTCKSFDSADGFRGLKVEDFILAIDQDSNNEKEIVGALALWNQQSFRSWQVHSYNGVPNSLRLVRNITSAIASRCGLSNHIPLPAPKTTLPYLFLSFCCIKDNSISTFKGLISAAQNAKSQTESLLLIGLHQNDALYELTSRLAAFTFHSRMLRFSFCHQSNTTVANCEKVPYFELGLL